MSDYVDPSNGQRFLSKSDRVAFLSGPIEEIGFTETYTEENHHEINRYFIKKTDLGTFNCILYCPTSLKFRKIENENSIVIFIGFSDDSRERKYHSVLSLVFSSELSCIKAASLSFKHFANNFAKISDEILDGKSFRFVPKRVSKSIIFKPSGADFKDNSTQMYLSENGLVISKHNTI